jgi:hypothetical protein
LERDGYGRPTVQELTGQSISSACPAVEVDWAAVLDGVPPVADGA